MNENQLNAYRKARGKKNRVARNSRKVNKRK